MNRFRNTIACLTVILFAHTTTAAAQTNANRSRDVLLVTPAWLAKHLSDPDLVLLHVGDPQEYAQKHIPGARFISLGDISVSSPDQAGLHLELPQPDSLRAHLAGLGISDRSRVVVYYGNDWVSPSTRVIFTLDYAGLGGAASLLDGGMNAWTAAGQPTTDVVPPARAGTLSALHTKATVADAAFVRAHIGQPGFAIVDARVTPFYTGAQTGGRGAHKTGHIAEAYSIPFDDVTDTQLHLKPAAELRAVFDKAGVKPGDTVIAYCHVGQQATAIVFAARTLGHPVLLYDGSFEDWSQHADYPVEK